MRLILKIESDSGQPSASQEWILSSGGWIGRDTHSDIVLLTEGVSRRHAEVELRDEQFFLRDHSENGTFINDLGKQIGRGNSVSLNSGDVIQIDEYQLKVDIESNANQTRDWRIYVDFGLGTDRPSTIALRNSTE